MPPKARFTRDKIEEAAYELAKTKGIESVAAREVAKTMGMTVTPIFTYFSGMEELRKCVVDRAKAEFVEYLKGSLEYCPAFKEFGLRWMRYAAKNPNLYRMMMEDYDGPASIAELLEIFPEVVDPMLQEIVRNYEVSEMAARGLLGHMLVYVNGLTGFLVRGDDSMCEEQLSLALGQVFLSLAARIKVLDGDVSVEQIGAMLADSGLMPRNKETVQTK